MKFLHLFLKYKIIIFIFLILVISVFSGCINCKGYPKRVCENCGDNPIEVRIVNRLEATGMPNLVKLEAARCIKGGLDADFILKGLTKADLTACFFSSNILDDTTRNKLIEIVDDAVKNIPESQVAAWEECYRRELGLKAVETKRYAPSEEVVRRYVSTWDKIRGDYEYWSRLNGSLRVLNGDRLNKDALEFGNDLSKVKDNDLRDVFQILKYEYVALALYVASTTSSDKIETISLSEKAIRSARQALDGIANLKGQALDGNEFAADQVQWIKNDNSKDRILYSLALAIAANARAGGKYSPSDVIDTLKNISRDYLRENEPLNDDDLKWAINEFDRSSPKGTNGE